MKLLQYYRNAQPRTKWFVLSAIWLVLLTLWGGFYPYVHLVEDRTNIPSEQRTK
ncbi:MAG: hypothetical protein Q8K75_01665 [Chlamydiales bacterium]|nr:hypothetical protein [Chlamydiales bacterium]